MCNRTSFKDCVCPHKHFVLFELFCQRGYFSPKGEKKTTLVYRGTGLGDVRKQQVRQADAWGIRRDLGPVDDIAAVRRRGLEREGGRVWKTRKKATLPQQGNTFMDTTRHCAFEDVFGLKMIFLHLLPISRAKEKGKKKNSFCTPIVVVCNKNFADHCA